MGKPELPPGWVRTSLTLDQVRMILRIYWTDRFERRRIGLKRGTPGVRQRIAKQIGAPFEVVKKITSMKEQNSRRSRFPTVSVDRIKTHIKTRLRRRYGEDRCET